MEQLRVAYPALLIMQTRLWVASFHTLPKRRREERAENNIRSLFTAPKGWSFIAADYGAMELRVLAHISKESNMQKAFNEGADLAYIYCQAPIQQEGNHQGRAPDSKDRILLDRIWWCGAFNLSETMGIPMSRAEKIIEDYKNVYPAIFEYMDFVNKFIKKNGYAYTIFGRKRNPTS
jgi:DNA polymerase-1